MSWRARLLVAATNLLVLAGCLELASRIYWQIVHEVPAFAISKIWEKKFPAFEKVYLDTATSTSGTFEVLVLGPSVWANTCGDLAERLERSLAQKLKRSVRVSNLSVPGHTSRDALLQYRKLDDRRFDLIVVYHGINDVFLNNIPSRLYREDYSHASRFRQIDALAEHPEHPYFVLPYTVRYLATRWQEQLRLRRQPSRDFLAEGEEVKTGPAFKSHITEIIELARLRGTKVLLSTIATYIPTNYSPEAFRAKELDYVGYVSALETWGTPVGVNKGIETHNGILREIAAANPETAILADMAERMPAQGPLYDDCCHFSTAGCEVFNQKLLEAVDWSALASRIIR